MRSTQIRGKCEYYSIFVCFNKPNLLKILVKKFSFGAAASCRVRVVRLNMEPNAMAMTVHTKQMTLYGIEKSGVGKDIRRGSEYSLSMI